MSANMKCNQEVDSGGSAMVYIEKNIAEQSPIERSTSGEEKAGCSSWIVEMEKMLEDTNPSVEMVRWKKTSIYRVPAWIKEQTNAKAYRPWLFSIGPFHHGEPDLLPMEEHKRRAMLHLVKRTGRPVGEFVAAIEEVVDKLQDAYQGLDDKWRGEDKCRFVEMMVIDGCFLLEILMVMNGCFLLDITKNHRLSDYAQNDPVFSKHSLLNLSGAIRADMVLIENQLPLLVLERLVAVRDGRPPSTTEINRRVCDFLGFRSYPGMGDLRIHILDIFHSSFCGGCQQHEEREEMEVIIPTATELSEAGVRFKGSNTPWVHDVGFENGVLNIPTLEIDDRSEKEFLNLRVFEQLHSDAGSDVTNYLLFMDHIIDSERDAGLLRSRGILKSWIGSDKESADLFNNLTMGAISNQSKELNKVLRKVTAHCMKRENRWRAIFVRTYLSNPWVFMSLIAAIVLLAATILQTVYTVVSFYTKI